MVGALGLAAALLLLAAGAAKLRAPSAAAAMLRRAAPGLPRALRQPAAVRIGGAAEVAVAAAVIGTGSRASLVLLAAGYALFAAVALRLAVVGRGASCGCFGGTDSPVGPAHVVLDVLAVAVAVAAAVAPPGPVGGQFDGAVLPGLIGTAQAVLLAYLGFLSITALPALAADRRRVTA
jgi:methylamine utilization protein MauE